MSTFFDTNVMVYALDGAEGRKHALADELLVHHLAAGTLRISTQVMQETYSVLTRKKGMPPADALTALETLPAGCVIGATAESVLRAITLAQRHRLSVWDGLIVQGALDGRCTTLLTEDLQSGRRFDELEVVNPFVQAVQQPAPRYAAARKAGPRRS